MWLKVVQQSDHIDHIEMWYSVDPGGGGGSFSLSVLFYVVLYIGLLSLTRFLEVSPATCN